MKSIIIAVILCLFAWQSAWCETKPIPQVVEIGIVLENIQHGVESYHQSLGISKWQFVDLYSKDDSSEYPLARMARGKTGDIYISLLQPLYGKSLLKSHFEKYGSSLFHIGFDGEFEDLEDYDIQSINNRNSFSGKWIDTYADFGINLFVHNSELSADDYWGESILDKSIINLEPEKVLHLGIVTNNVKKSALNYFKKLGVGPWLRVDFKSPHLTNTQYLGAKGSVQPFIKIAYAMWGGLQLELLEPVSGISPHRDFLIDHGAGAHHLKMKFSKDHDQLLLDYLNNGMNILMQSDNGGDGRTATYIDTKEDLGFVLEITRSHQGVGTLPIIGTVPQVKK